MEQANPAPQPDKMSPTVPEQKDGIELQALKPAEAKAGEQLIDFSDVGEADKGVAPAVPEKENNAVGFEVVDATTEKKGFLAPLLEKGLIMKARLLEKGFDRSMCRFTAGIVFAFLATLAIIGLGVAYGVEKTEVDRLKSQPKVITVGRIVHPVATVGNMIRGTDYVDGYPAFLEATGINIDHVARDAVSQSTSDPDVCEGETTAKVQSTLTATVPVWTDYVNSTVTATSTTSISHGTSILALSTNVSFETSATATSSTMVVGPTVTPFMATTTSYETTSDMTSSLSSSSLVSLNSSTTTESCGEWGDGAGPCARPYGAPNKTPASVLSSMAAESAIVHTPEILGSTTTLLSALGLSSSESGSTTASSVAFTSSFTDTSSLVDMSTQASTFTLIVPTSVTVTVTTTTSLAGSCNISASSETMAGIDGPTTYYGTSTLTSLRTSTVNAEPLTTTETAVWRNSSTAVTTANFTLTLKKTVSPGANVSYTGVGPLASGGPGPVVTSGGDQTAPKPLGASSSGGTGNGVYCVVMLVAVLALLV